ncbi:MAG: cytochrome c [Thiohalomonadales bacterium]
MIKQSKLSILLSLALAFSPAIVNSAGISQAEILASQCFVCHGQKGEGSGKIPELRDLEKSDIIESLQGFKTGEEKSTIMERYAKAYTKAEIELLANYFSKLK